MPTRSVIAIPLAMGLAIASGLKPEMGIVGGAIAALIGAAFGGSKYQVYGPTAAFIPIVAGVMAAFGDPGQERLDRARDLDEMADPVGLQRVDQGVGLHAVNDDHRAARHQRVQLLVGRDHVEHRCPGDKGVG